MRIGVTLFENFRRPEFKEFAKIVISTKIWVGLKILVKRKCLDDFLECTGETFPEFFTACFRVMERGIFVSTIILASSRKKKD
jgi:hypothetical protein